MKRFTTLCFTIFAFFGLASAQSTFSVADTEVWVIAPASVEDAEGHTTIQNLTNATQTIRWERTNVDTTPGCQSQVCDLNLCYLPTVSTKTFNIAPNATGNLIMHFLNPNAIEGASGVIHLKLRNVEFPSDSVNIVFLFTSDLSDAKDLSSAVRVSVFPNPATDYFQLDNAEGVHRIRVLSLDSREVARYTATPGASYPMAGLSAGSYMLALEDKNGQIFQSLNLVKR